jgi:hypothetical protein
MQYQGLVILLLGGHTTHVTLRVLTYAGSQRIIVIQLLAHSSHLTQPLDLCVFGVFKVLHKTENKAKALRDETLKIYHALAPFYTFTIIPMVRWSFDWAGSRLNPERLFLQELYVQR